MNRLRTIAATVGAAVLFVLLLGAVFAGLFVAAWLREEA